MSIAVADARVRPLYFGRAIFPEGDTMIDPKWYVMAAALVAELLLLNFNLTLGLIGAGVIAAIFLIRIALWVWLAPERGEPESERGALVERFRKLTSNRRLARLKELGKKRGTDAG